MPLIKFVDMFSGIGGFREGLTRAGGFECVGHCEIDKYANRSYNALFDTKGEWFIEDKTNPDSPRIQQVNTALKQLRQEERLCRKIAEHSLEVQQHLTEARRDRAEQQQREQEHERDRRPNIDLTL